MRRGRGGHGTGRDSISGLKVLSHIEFQSSRMSIFRTPNVQCLRCFEYTHDGGVFYARGVFSFQLSFEQTAMKA